MKTFLKIFFFAILFFMFYYSDGQKSHQIGFAEEYLNKKFKPCSKAKAKFKRYRYYYEQNVSHESLYSSLGKGKLYLDSMYLSDSVFLLNGVYKFYDFRKRLVVEKKYMDGKFVYHKTFHPETKVMIEFVDNTNKYEGQEGSFCMYQYDQWQGEVIHKTYFCKRNDKWGWYDQSTRAQF